MWVVEAAVDDGRSRKHTEKKMMYQTNEVAINIDGCSNCGYNTIDVVGGKIFCGVCGRERALKRTETPAAFIEARGRQWGWTGCHR